VETEHNYVSFEAVNEVGDSEELGIEEAPGRRHSFVEDVDEEFDKVAAGCGLRPRAAKQFLGGLFLFMVVVGCLAATIHTADDAFTEAHMDMGEGTCSLGEGACEAQDLVRHSAMQGAAGSLNIPLIADNATQIGRSLLQYKDATPSCLGPAIGLNACIDMQSLASVDVETILQSLGAHRQILSLANSIVFPIMNALFSATKAFTGAVCIGTFTGKTIMEPDGGDPALRLSDLRETGCR